jgi:hypothetical protein
MFSEWDSVNPCRGEISAFGWMGNALLEFMGFTLETSSPVRLAALGDFGDDGLSSVDPQDSTSLQWMIY